MVKTPLRFMPLYIFSVCKRANHSVIGVTVETITTTPVFRDVNCFLKPREKSAQITNCTTLQNTSVLLMQFSSHSRLKRGNWKGFNGIKIFSQIHHTFLMNTAMSPIM